MMMVMGGGAISKSTGYMASAKEDTIMDLVKKTNTCLMTLINPISEVQYILRIPHTTGTG
jgi:hypothetical protein